MDQYRGAGAAGRGAPRGGGYPGAQGGPPRGGSAGRGGSGVGRGGYDASAQQPQPPQDQQHQYAPPAGYPPPPPPGYDPYMQYGQPPHGYPMGYMPGFMPPEMTSPLDTEIQAVLREIHTEVAGLETTGDQFRNARRLLNSERERLENNIDPEWLEVDVAKPVKVCKKILIPIYRHPQFNFIGKVLGPKGATLQTLCKTHKCHIYILGRGSTKDREKEAELLASGDPQHAHFSGPLHVKVETTAPAYVAYGRVAAVIEELSRILQPIHEDTTPMHLRNGAGNAGGQNEGSDKSGDEKDKEGGAGGSGAGRGGRGGFRGGPGGGRGGFRGAPYGRGGSGHQGRGRGGQPVGFRPY